MVGNQVGLAITLPHLGHCLGADVMGAIELHILTVASRQCAHLIDDVHEHLRAVCRQSGTRYRVLSQNLLGRVGSLHERHRISHLDANRSAHNDRFQMLGAHHRTYTGPASGAIKIVHDSGIQNRVFSCQPNRCDAHIGITTAVPQRGFSLPDRFAP